MARKVHSIEVESDGETRTFYYKRPSYALTMRVVDMLKDAEREGRAVNVKINEVLFSECMAHEDGTPYTKGEIKELLEGEDFEVVDALAKPLMPKKGDEGKG